MALLAAVGIVKQKQGTLESFGGVKVKNKVICEKTNDG